MNDAARRRLALAEMAYAEVSNQTGAFQLTDAATFPGRSYTFWCVRSPDPVERRYRYRAGALALLEVHGPAAEVVCDACRTEHADDCAWIPVGYALVGGRCWKAVRDGRV